LHYIFVTDSTNEVIYLRGKNIRLIDLPPAKVDHQNIENNKKKKK